MKIAVELMWLTLFKSTGVHGGETASLAMARLVSRVAELTVSRRGGGNETPPTTTKSGRNRKKKRKETETPTKEGEEKPPKRTSEWKDEVGALGPNGHKRMVGGNPKGGKCKGFANGGCNFKTCSFSHA